MQDFLCFGGRTTMVQIYNRVYKKSLSVINSESGESSLLALQQNFKSNDLLINDDQDISAPVKTIAKKLSKKRMSKTTNAKNKEGEEPVLKQAKLEIESVKTWVKGCDVPETYIHSLYGNPNPYTLARCLEELTPRLDIYYIAYNLSKYVFYF